MKNKTSYSKGWARFCGWLLRRLGWTAVGGPPPEKKVIFLGVPHTSFWDFVIAYLFYTSFGEVAHVMIKKELFFWPLGGILRACGCIPVDRSNATSLVLSLIEQMEEEDFFKLAIAPEGTRKAVKKWKNGFHLIARETGAKVYVGYYDWGRKEITVGQEWPLTDDANADMKRIQEHYSTLGLKGRNRSGYCYD